VEIAKPDVAVLTAISAAHTEGLKDVNGVLREKLKLIEGMKDRGVGFVNGDFENLKIAAMMIPKRIVLFGTTKGVDIQAQNIKWDKYGLSFVIESNRFFMPVLGRFWVYSALVAYCIGREFGVGIAEISDVFAGFDGLDGRMKLYEKNEITIIDDTYNANPLAMKEALMTVYGLKARRRIAFLGDMLELGELAFVSHRELGRLVKELGFDIVYFVGKLSKDAYEQATANNDKDVRWFSSVDEALESVKSLELQKGDIILIKGSRRMNMERLFNAITEVIK
ncbi:MAG: UDP-N-acetylmuramoyl-tripeptide--D-alanyl-D-alanine ligase, partial [bacterium]